MLSMNMSYNHNLNTSHEYREFIEWYHYFKKTRPHFKYSFEFLDGLLSEIMSRQQFWHVELLSVVEQWITDLKILIHLKTELKQLLSENLHRYIDESMTLDLISVKKDLVHWIQCDQSVLNQIDVVYIDENDAFGRKCRKVKIFDEFNGYQQRPYILLGQARDEVQYRMYLNNQYLDKIVDYLIQCIGLNRRINSFYKDYTTKESHDLRLHVIQNDWEP